MQAGKTKTKKLNIKIGRSKTNWLFTEKLTEAQLNHHIHVVGASGYGKTVLLTKILKQQIAHGMGAMFIDLKSDLETINDFKSLAASVGREGDVSLFSISDHSISTPYNIIGHGSATMLRDRIMQSLVWSEEFYKAQAASYLLNVLIPLCYLRDKKGLPLHLGTVFKTVSQKSFLAEIAELIPQNYVFEREAIEHAFEFAKDNSSWSSIQRFTFSTRINREVRLRQACYK